MYQYRMLHTPTYRRRRAIAAATGIAAATIGGYIFIIGLLQICTMWGLSAA